MSTLLASPPVPHLHIDIILHIVKMNADMYSDNTALETTLATSRVCQVWRNLMLNMTRLWAHLIDLDYLHQYQDTLKDELLRRSGTVLLWIKARRCALHGVNSRAGCTVYALDFLGSNWGRIQKFEISINTRYVEETKWAPLCVPAPYLESVNISLNDSDFDVEPPLHLLFGDCSPMLREFRSNRFSPALESPWLFQLYSMKLSGKIKVSEALELVEQTQNLVTLQLYNLAMEGSTLPFPFVTLKKLDHLVLYSSGDHTCAVFLDHVDVPAACRLEFVVNEMPLEETIGKPSLCHIVRTVSTFSQRYFAQNTPTKLMVKYSPTYFALMDHNVANYSGFRFSLGLALGDSFSTDTFSMLLNEFTMLDFTNIAELTLKFFNTDAVDLPVSESIALFARLPAVHTLDLDPPSLYHLLRVQEAIETSDTGPEISFPFPGLEVLKIHPLPASSSLASSNPISKFILKRIALGQPISVLDISQSTLEVLPKMSLFKEVDDLKVVWRHTDTLWNQRMLYICRVGNSGDLLHINV